MAREDEKPQAPLLLYPFPFPRVEELTLGPKRDFHWNEPPGMDFRGGGNELMWCIVLLLLVISLSFSKASLHNLSGHFILTRRLSGATCFNRWTLNKDRISRQSNWAVICENVVYLLDRNLKMTYYVPGCVLDYETHWLKSYSICANKRFCYNNGTPRCKNLTFGFFSLIYLLGISYEYIM